VPSQLLLPHPHPHPLPLSVSVALLPFEVIIDHSFFNNQGTHRATLALVDGRSGRLLQRDHNTLS